VHTDTHSAVYCRQLDRFITVNWMSQETAGVVFLIGQMPFSDVQPTMAKQRRK